MKISNVITIGVLTLGVGVLTSTAHARGYPGQFTSGEAGYKVGCSAAASLRIPSCGELPSGKKFMPPSPSTSAPKAPKSDAKSGQSKEAK